MLEAQTGRKWDLRVSLQGVDGLVQPEQGRGCLPGPSTYSVETRSVLYIFKPLQETKTK